MKIDSSIEKKAWLAEEKIQNLNFISDSGRYLFRKHFRSGLRSHIFEVLKSEDVLKESCGVVIKGMRLFPRAKPVKMFRILKNRFDNKEAVLHEIEKYNLLLNFLGPELIALSDEFIVDYTGTGKNKIVLCGLQEYIEGQLLDPWRSFTENYLHNLLKPMTVNVSQLPQLVKKARQNIARLVNRTKQMIMDTGYIPDLAGIGNLILLPDGRLKLVDINNITKLQFNSKIPLDDKGYPSCDVSINVMFLLEQNIMQKDIKTGERLYRFFLKPERARLVKDLEKKFYENHGRSI